MKTIDISLYLNIHRALVLIYGGLPTNEVIDSILKRMNITYHFIRDAVSDKDLTSGKHNGLHACLDQPVPIQKEYF